MRYWSPRKGTRCACWGSCRCPHARFRSASGCCLSKCTALQDIARERDSGGGHRCCRSVDGYSVADRMDIWSDGISAFTRCTYCVLRISNVLADTFAKSGFSARCFVPPPLSPPSAPSSASTMLPIPSPWAEAYRYLVLYPRALYLRLLFLYLSYSISRSSRSSYIHFATLLYIYREALYVSAPHSLRCTFSIFDT